MGGSTIAWADIEKVPAKGPDQEEDVPRLTQDWPRELVEAFEIDGATDKISLLGKPDKRADIYDRKSICTRSTVETHLKNTLTPSDQPRMP